MKFQVPWVYFQHDNIILYSVYQISDIYLFFCYLLVITLLFWTFYFKYILNSRF